MRKINFGQLFLKNVKILQKFVILNPKPYEIWHFQVVDPKSQKTQNCQKSKFWKKQKNRQNFIKNQQKMQKFDKKLTKNAILNPKPYEIPNLTFCSKTIQNRQNTKICKTQKKNCQKYKKIVKKSTNSSKNRQKSTKFVFPTSHFPIL